MPKGLIVGCQKSRPTASLLAHIAKWDYTETYIDDISQYSTIFRYGNSSELSLPEPGGGPLDRVAKANGIRLINQAPSIAVACNKFESRRSFIGTSIPCPETLRGGETQVPMLNYPVLIRPLFHSQGRNAIVVKNYDELCQYNNSKYYLSELISKKDEFRVLVFYDKALEISIKTKTRENADELIRNHRSGWVFKRIPYVEMRDANITLIARRACSCLGLEFGAVDICTSIEAERPYVFEVNTAPGLISRKVEKLVGKLQLLNT